MNWQAKRNVFVLTKEEQRTIAFIILALVLGLATMHYRETHRRQSPNAKPGAVMTPSPDRSR